MAEDFVTSPHDVAMKLGRTARQRREIEAALFDAMADTYRECQAYLNQWHAGAIQDFNRAVETRRIRAAQLRG